MAPTNQYGVEVTVDTTTSMVTSVNNRLESGSDTGTAIPAGSYVLSGHGRGPGYAGQWLLDFATVGKLVTLNATAPAPGPDPKPDAQRVITNAAGATVHAVAGTDVARGVNELVIYTTPRQWPRPTSTASR